MFGDCEAMILRSSGISLVLVVAVALHVTSKWVMSSAGAGVSGNRF